MNPEPSSPVRGFLLHTFHRTQSAHTAVFGVGRLETGETFAFADHRDPPSFYIRLDDCETVRELAPRYECSIDTDTGRTTMDGQPVASLSARKLSALRKLSRQLETDGIRTYEADVSHSRRYLADRGVRGPICIGGTWRPGTGVDRVYIDPTVESGDWRPELAILALDIETTPDASEVLAVSLVGSGAAQCRELEEIHLVGAPSADDPPQLQCHPGERELLAALAARVLDIDPDVLTGWNLIDFDLTVLQRRFKAFGLPFNLGRSNDASWYQEGNVWGGSRMVVYGRQVLDALHLIRGSLQRFDDYRLGTVAQAILGRGKTVEAGTDESMPELIIEAYRDDRNAFCEYCLEDSRLVRDILKKEGLIELTLRRGVLTGLPLERAWGSVAAFDFLYITELHKRGMVAPTNGVDRAKLGGAPGGLVMTSKAGLYRHVFVFDFKSLYPSIIRTFNIDPLSHIQAVSGSGSGSAEEEASHDLITAPNGARFVREPGILPNMLEGFFASRDLAKADGDELASYAYKIVMNSFYGVLATDACRFSEEKLAGAITGFGHYFLRWTRELLENEGSARVLYGDTDSLFVDAGLPDDVTAEAALARGLELREWINGELAEHVSEVYDLHSHLDLEFEKYYRRFFLPPMRGSGDRGRAKGYAGLVVDADGSEEVEIVGLEAVRRDWTDLAHDLQRDLLARLFQDAPGQELDTCVTEWIRLLRTGEKDGDLVYRKNLRKSTDKYTRTSPPHVVAARLLPKPSGVIRYVITIDGPQPLGHVTAALDYEHYIQKQIRPIVHTIGQVCDLDVEAAVTGVQDLFRSYAK